jgi:hypothetical protein
MKAAETAARQPPRAAPRADGRARGQRYAARPRRSNWLDFIEDLMTQLDIPGVEVQTDASERRNVIAAEAPTRSCAGTGLDVRPFRFPTQWPRDGIPGAALGHVSTRPVKLDDLGEVGSEVVIVDDLGDTIAPAWHPAEDGRTARRRDQPTQALRPC